MQETKSCLSFYLQFLTGLTGLFGFISFATFQKKVAKPNPALQAGNTQTYYE
jgi:hypothetical protein